MPARTRVRWLLVVACGLAPALPQGCATATRKAAVPESLQAAAKVPGFGTTIRYFPTDATHVEQFEKDYLDSLTAETMARRNAGEENDSPPSTFLAISGGGDNGAFGAGLLSGWSAAGSRPEFKLVTGVSTGALIAPFAF